MVQWSNQWLKPRILIDPGIVSLKFATFGGLPLIFQFKMKFTASNKLVHLKQLYEMSKTAVELPTDLNETVR